MTSNPIADQSTFSYLPPKITLIQIRSFENAASTMVNGRTASDKMLILEGENFCQNEVCGNVYMGPLDDDGNENTPRSLIRNGQERIVSTSCAQYSGPSAPPCQYSHNKIVLVTNADSGTIWITAGMNSTVKPWKAQETNVILRPPKQFRFVSPEISSQNKTDLNSLAFDTEGGCEVFISGKYFGQVASDLCVTVGSCIPRPATCGDSCLDGSGEVVGESVTITPGSLTLGRNNEGSFSFTVPPGQGSFNDFFVWRGDQASINDFVSPVSSLREYALNYKRVGDADQEGDCSNPSAVFQPSSALGITSDGDCSKALPGSCKKTTSKGAFCILPSCYSTSVPVLKLAATGATVTTIPTSGAYVNIVSTQFGSANSKSKIIAGAYYEEVPRDFGGQGCLPVGCDWLLSVNEHLPKCGCKYPNLQPNQPNLWTAVDPEGRSKVWTNNKITNVFIPPGTGKGYMLQVLVNGVPSAPMKFDYEPPTILSITDDTGQSNPAYGGTTGGVILTMKGTNFGCYPTTGTIDANGEIPDGLLTPTELLRIYDGNLRTVDDLLFDFDKDSYDESIKYPNDENRQRKERIETANGISRKEFDAWLRRDATSFNLRKRGPPNLCQGPPAVLLLGVEQFPCPVISLSEDHTELKCNASAGEGKELDVSLLPAGSSWTVAFGSGVATKNSLETETSIAASSFSFKIPSISSIETSIPDIDCQERFGHACGPSSALIRSAILSSTNSSDGRITATNKTVAKPVVIVIRGSNFGRANGAPIQIKMICKDGARYCTGQELTLDSSTIVRSQNKITIQLSPGIGENLAVQVELAGQSNVVSLVGRFSYLSPKITAIYPDYGKTLEWVTDEDIKDGKFFYRRFVEGDKNPTDGMLSLNELRSLLDESEALREVVDLTKRDADFTFNVLDFDADQRLTLQEFVSISFSPTDGCETASFESLTQWQDRVTKATKAERDANPKQYERMCLKPRTMIYFGENLGPVLENEKIPSRTRVWLGSCSSFVSKETCVAMERCVWRGDEKIPCAVQNPEFKGAFDIYDARTSLLDSKCAELSRYDTTEQSWFITCSPVGLGVNHRIFVSINDRETVSDVRFNFALPSITSSEPRPYDANGQDIVIRGLNLGGVLSPTEVNVSGLSCLEAKWNPSYHSDGLPYVQCRTQRNVVGAHDVTMTVAMQQAAPAQRYPDVTNVTQQLSRFHSVCKSEEPNSSTGEERTFYGSPGELCSLCPVGSICQRETYVQPGSKPGFWKDQLDLTEGDETVTTLTEPLIPDDRMSKRSLDDMKRALGESNAGSDVRRGACAPER